MEAISVLKKANSNGKMRGIIESREKAEHVIATRIHSAFNNGKNEGKIEGKIEAAKIMLEIGLSKSEIAAKLGLKETDF